MTTLAESARRYRLNVPKEDLPVQRWIDAQIDKSASIRALIREDILRNGYTDATCRDVNVKKGPGRPTLESRNRQVEDELQKLDARKAELLQYAEKPAESVVSSEPVYPKQQEPYYRPPVQPVVQQPVVNDSRDDLLGLL